MDNGLPRSKGESPHLRRRFALGDCRIRRDTHIYSFRIFSVLQAVLTAMITWQSAGQTLGRYCVDDGGHARLPRPALSLGEGRGKQHKADGADAGRDPPGQSPVTEIEEE